METKTKQYLFVTVVGVSLFAALMNLPVVLAFAGKVISLILPVIVGAILALFINVPLSGIEKRLKRFAGKNLRISNCILSVLFLQYFAFCSC